MDESFDVCYLRVFKECKKKIYKKILFRYHVVPCYRGSVVHTKITSSTFSENCFISVRIDCLVVGTS